MTREDVKLAAYSEIRKSLLTWLESTSRGSRKQSSIGIVLATEIHELIELEHFINQFASDDQLIQKIGI